MPATMRRYPRPIAAIEASGVADRDKVAQLYKGIGGTYYNAKQYDQAIAAFSKAVSR